MSDSWAPGVYPQFFVRDTGQALHLYKLDPIEPSFEWRWRDGEWQPTEGSPLMGWITTGDVDVDRVDANTARSEFPDAFRVSAAAADDCSSR